MRIGIPRETKVFEYRVALTPAGVCSLGKAGHVVFVERGAGLGAGFGDGDYKKAGARIVPSKQDLYKNTGMIVKVKEPQPAEYPLLRSGLVLFAFLHLAANTRLARELQKRKVRAIPCEEMKDEKGGLPILKPMSEIAGLLAPLIGANYLRKDLGGKGTLLPAVGLGGTGHVTVIGAGHVGSNALKIAHGLGASVTVYDINLQRLQDLSSCYSERVQFLSDPRDLSEILKRTDLLIGAVLVPGRAAPRVVTSRMVKLLEPGSVIVDVAVDQGGCVETIRPTTLKNPVYKRYGVIHYGVTNIPSLVARTATEALSSAMLPYIIRIANS